MIVALFALNKLIELNNSFVKIILCGTVGAVVFFIMCMVFKIEEFNEGLEIILNKFYRGSR